MGEEIDPVLQAGFSSFMARLDDQSASALTDALQAFIDVRFTDQSYSRLLTVKLVQKVQADPTSLTTDLAVQLACIAVDLENCGCDMRAERGGARFVEGLRRQLEEAIPNMKIDNVLKLPIPFILRFLNDDQRLVYLRRLAKLRVGIVPESEQHLAAAKKIEEAVRRDSFEFLALIPSYTKTYLAEVKARLDFYDH